MLRRLSLLVMVLVLASLRGASQLAAAPPPSAPADLPQASAQPLPYNWGKAHITPMLPRPGANRESTAAVQPNAIGAMTYHNGPVMPAANVYVVFWLPSGQHFEPAPN
ncbi:MAG: hypothetical protein ACR2PL_03405, partial [Dehalococcoidia bacterium]